MASSRYWETRRTTAILAAVVMSDEFDLDAFEAEATGEPFRFRFAGESYELPARMDMIALAAMSDGDLATGLRRLLGADQWQRIKESDAVLNDRKMARLFERYAKHVGSTMGELSASTSSS